MEYGQSVNCKNNQCCISEGCKARAWYETRESLTERLGERLVEVSVKVQRLQVLFMKRAI